MGGQDTKAIRVAADGGVIDFCMNDKCAAGTGRFLSPLPQCWRCRWMSWPLLPPPALIRSPSAPPVPFLQRARSWPGLQGQVDQRYPAGGPQAIASRSLALLKRVGLQPAITFTGGVSRNSCMVAQLERLLGSQLQVGEQTPFAGALGAALFARDRLLAGPQELQG